MKSKTLQLDLKKYWEIRCAGKNTLLFLVIVWKKKLSPIWWMQSCNSKIVICRCMILTSTKKAIGFFKGFERRHNIFLYFIVQTKTKSNLSLRQARFQYAQSMFYNDLSNTLDERWFIVLLLIDTAGEIIS